MFAVRETWSKIMHTNQARDTACLRTQLKIVGHSLMEEEAENILTTIPGNKKSVESSDNSSDDNQFWAGMNPEQTMKLRCF